MKVLPLTKETKNIVASLVVIVFLWVFTAILVWLLIYLTTFKFFIVALAATTAWNFLTDMWQITKKVWKA